MKRTIHMTILMVLALSFFNVAPPKFGKSSSKLAVIQFTTEVIDYGNVTQNSNGTRLFTFTNTGDTPLLITNVKTTCGCTVPSYSKTPILPGETGELNIKYNTKRLGAFSRTVIVTSNAEGGNKILKIKGTIVAP